MVETISPVVYGTRTRWAGALALHAVGATATAAAFGALVAALAAALGAPWGRAGAAFVAAVAVLYLIRELAEVRVPVPQLRRQVPDWWRTYFGRPVAAFLYGAGLGVGFFTFLGQGTLVVVTVGAAATGRPVFGALVMAPFGLARGLAPLVSARSREPEDGRRLVDRLSSMPDRLRTVLNGVALAAVAVAAAAAAWRTDGGWGAAAAAVLAVAFAWSAIAKIAGWSRWRRALATYALPPATERVASWAVPAAELLIPALALLGRPRAAGAVAIVVIVVFSGAIVRLALRDGARVSCGCFGRGSIDVRLALVRNAALAAAAASSWVAAPPDPALRLPSGGETVPAFLTAAAVVVAGVTVWRTSVWMRRGNA
jgi:Methylamine utilisation protein MauE